MFKTAQTNNRPGFSMTFANGWTISVQWHQGAYCDGRHSENAESANAEIAIWDYNGDWCNFGNDQVKGYCTPDEVLNWMEFTAKQSPVDSQD